VQNHTLSAFNFIKTEAQRLFSLTQKIGDNFERSCKLLLACEGRIIVCSMGGKSAHLAAKIAATFASTGSPALFVNPIEIYQGNLGLICERDVALFISNSGETPELINLASFLNNLDVPFITLTEHLDSHLAKISNVAIDISAEDDQHCPKALAHLVSATNILVMGDALAIALLDARGFTREDFSIRHPGGSLGKRLLLGADDLCHRGKDLPIVGEHATFSEALIEATHKKLGMTCITNSEGTLLGVFTDGDVRRALQKGFDVHRALISDMMTRNCVTIKTGMLAIDALKVMQEYKVTCLVIITDQKQPVGVVNMYDILKAGLH
jgi:arabinose-5-phosphate isomerase